MKSETIKVSIITVVYNSIKTIEDAILSVASQTYPAIEHIIIDGASTDSTLSVISKHQDKLAYVLSEPDFGIYDAMNKGLRAATGDVIGFLNSDDIYADPTVIAQMVENISTRKVDAVFGDLVYVARNDTTKVLRYYESKSFNSEMIAKGWMPAHPTLFFNKQVYEKYGKLKTDYKIAADFEFVARVFSKRDISYYYLPVVMVRMRKGGVSTKNLRQKWIINKEILRACSENGIQTNVFKILSRYPRKIIDLLKANKLY